MKKTLKIPVIILACAAAIALAGWLSFRLCRPDSAKYWKSIGLSVPEGIRTFGYPNRSDEWYLSLSVAADNADWKKLEELTAEDRKTEVCTYFHNLAEAKLGKLSDNLLDYYQPFDRGLFLQVNSDSKPHVIAQSGEVWWQLGELTMAEHSTMLGMIFSPKKTGGRFFRRLAEINLAKGDAQAAAKYQKLYGKPIGEDWKVKAALAPQADVIHRATDIRASLQALLESNPANMMAYEYLLCYDLLTKNLEAFVKDFKPGIKNCRLYEEAALIFMASTGNTGSEWINRFGVGEQTYREFVEFSTIFESNKDLESLTPKFSKTYWYYFKFATLNENS